jgi:hypothetical protein
MGAPDEHRCTAIRTRWRKGKPPGQCEKPAKPGADVCYMHSGIPHLGPPPDERRCTGTTKNRANAGERCPNWAMEGQNVCLRHGGGSPQARNKAAAKIEEAKLNEQANRLLVKLGAEPCDNPLTALAERAGVELALFRSLGAVVNELYERDELRYMDAKGAEQIRSEVAMFERCSARLDALLGGMAKLKLDDRLVAIEEEKAKIFMDAVQAGLASIGVVGKQAQQAMVVMARKLHAIA